MDRGKLIALVAFFAILGPIAVYLNWPAPRAPTAKEAAERRRVPTKEESARKLADVIQRSEKKGAAEEDNRLAPEDKIWAQWQAKPGRWKILPTFIRDVYLDGAGRSWFEAEGSEGRLRQSITDAAAGKTTLIRGGRLLLVDKQGRFWAIGSSKQNILYCYDGKDWKQERYAVGGPVVPTTLPAKQYGHFSYAGFEDSAGNLFFVGGYFDNGPSYGIHTRKPDGTWTYTAFPKPRGSPNHLEYVQFMEQPGGRVVIFPQRFRETRQPQACILYYFDGSNWSEINPIVCRDKNHSVESVVPLADGSIATLCSEQRLWTYWPNSKAGTKLEQLVLNLSDADPKKREGAASNLIAMGPQILQPLRKLSGLPQDPEGKERLHDVLTTLDQISRDDHEGAGLHGGRFLFDYGYVASRTRVGGVRLHVQNCIDRRTNKKYEEAYLTIGPDGQWDIRAIPLEDWHLAGLKNVPTSCFEDSRGGLWVGDGLRTTPAFSLDTVAPEGLRVDEPQLEDAQQRLYFHPAPFWMVFDHSLPEDKPELQRQPFRGTCLVHLASERSAWGVDDDQWPHNLFQVTPQGQYKSIPGNTTQVGINHLVPLKGGCLVGYRFRWTDVACDMSPGIWDGNRWIKADNVQSLIHLNAQRLVSMVGPGFSKWGLNPDYLASDGTHLWHYMTGFKHRPGQEDGFATIPYEVYEFFDGEKWRDVRAELNFEEVVFLYGSIRQGRAILVGSRSNVREISYDGKNLVQTPMANFSEQLRAMPFYSMVDGNDGEVWMRSLLNQGGVCVWKDGQLQQLSQNVTPKLRDSKGRIWFVAGDGAIVVKIGEQWIRSEPHLFNVINSMAEGPDGRMWVVHLNGLSQIKLDESSKPPIKEVGHWSLGSPKNSIRDIFFDGANGFWFASSGRSITRFQLPVTSP